MDGQPEIAANQTVVGTARTINAFRFPELQDYMTRYQMVTLHSLGARFMSGMESVAGNVGILVLTANQAQHYTVPHNQSHAWLKRNGCKVSPSRSQANAPPASDLVKQTVTADPSTGANTPGTSLGAVYWVWEGPAFGQNRTHLGEIEVYVNATFEGL